MKEFFKRLRTPTAISIGEITHAIVGLMLFFLLYSNFFLKIKIIPESVVPYLFFYFGYLIILPLIRNIREFTQSKERKKFVTARDELTKAVSNAENHPEDVMNYLRQAIDLSIKDKCGFTKISNMYEFLKYANECNFPLPSYDLIYRYFQEGSGRIHQGRLHTRFEIAEAIRTVTNFMDVLETTKISQKDIDDFKLNCKWVE